jgi:dynein heavy chain
LQSAKTTSEESNLKIEESVILEKTIERVRNEYRSVAIRGSVLYFVIKDLNLIDPMY